MEKNFEWRTEYPEHNYRIYIRDISKFVDLDKGIDAEYCTPELIEWLFEHYPEGLQNIPIDGVSAEKRKEIFYKLDEEDKIDFVLSGIMDDILTLAMAKEMFNTQIRKNFRGRFDNNIVLKLRGLNLMDQELANKIIAYNPAEIPFIPASLITIEMVNDALKYDARVITYIPGQYQTIENHKIVLDASYKYLSRIPEEYLTDEAIIYAININGEALNHAQKNRRTAELGKLAFSKNTCCFRSLPDELKTHDVCLRTLLKQPKSIIHVPVHIITDEFMKEIENLDIIIPENFMGYVNECVKKNNLIKDYGKLEIPRIKLPENVANITIERFEMYFSSGVLNF